MRSCNSKYIFKKREEHFLTFKSESNMSQIDFFFIRRMERKTPKDCKVITRESLTQHRLVVLDVCIKRWNRKKDGCIWEKT